MLSNLKAVLIAWALSILIIGGGGAMIEMSYSSGTDDDQTDETDTVESATSTPKEGDEQAAQNQDTLSNNTPSDLSSNAGLQPEKTGRPTSRPPIRRGALPIQSDADLLQSVDVGLVPRKGPDGKTPFNTYGGFDPSGGRGPRVAIMVTNMGMNRRMTNQAIQTLPRSVSLAFSPYSSGLKNWGEQSRTDGHEVFLMVPMEPLNYPNDDPGQLALLTKNSDRRNLANFHATLARFDGYVGVTSYMGSRFTAQPKSLDPIMQDIAKRGLMYVDAKDTQFTQAPPKAQLLGIPVAINDRYIDTSLTAQEISQALIDLEDRALANGVALGFSSNKKVSVEAIKLWSDGLMRKGISLVPVSSIANLQTIR